MTPFQIWEKMIKGKVYTKDAVERRVNTVFAVGQVNDGEYTALMQLITSTYTESA